MIIQKFGGTSLGKPEYFKNAVDIMVKNNSKKIVVLSAISGITNLLQEVIDLRKQNMHEQTFNTLEKIRERFINFVNELFIKAEDIFKTQTLVNEHISKLFKITGQDADAETDKKIIVYGEIITSEITEYYIKSIGIKCKLINAIEFMRIDQNREPDYYYIKEQLKTIINEYEFKLYLTQGFICKNFTGEIDNFNRGGSDKSATVTAKVLNAEKVEIWSDRDGMLNNDPRFVSDTFTVKMLSYEEAEELASFGAKILHPSCIKPAKESKIKVFLKNTFNQHAEGTLISKETGESNIKAVAAKDQVTVIKITASDMLSAYGFLSKIFEVFEYYKTAIDMIATSEVTVAISIDDTSNLNNIIHDLNKYGITEVFTDQSIIAVVGNISPEHKGIVYRVLESVKDIPVRMISYGAGSRSINFLVNTSEKLRTLNLLNEHLFLQKTKNININEFENTCI